MIIQRLFLLLSLGSNMQLAAMLEREPLLQETAAAEILGILNAAQEIFPDIVEKFEQFKTIKDKTRTICIQTKDAQIAASLLESMESAKHQARKKYRDFTTLLSIHHDRKDTARNLFAIIGNDVIKRFNRLPKLATYDQFLNHSFVPKSQL